MRGSSPAQTELFVYNRSSRKTTQITDDTLADSDPRISGDNIVWIGDDGNDSEIFLHNTTTRITTQITDNKYPDNAPRIKGQVIVWVATKGDSEIFLYDLWRRQTFQVTNNSVHDLYPDTNGEFVVWADAKQKVWLAKFSCDFDEDGFEDIRCGGTDCDDTNASVNPRMSEVAKNLLDDDCDGNVDQGCGTLPSKGYSEAGINAGIYFILLFLPILWIFFIRRGPRESGR